jgi:hypothetical protein
MGVVKETTEIHERIYDSNLPTIRGACSAWREETNIDSYWPDTSPTEPLVCKYRVNGVNLVQGTGLYVIGDLSRQPPKVIKTLNGKLEKLLQ